MKDLKGLQHTRTGWFWLKNTLKQTKLQTYCSFWRPERIGECRLFYCHSQWQSNLIWQANVVTDSSSGAFYGSSVLLVNPSPRHSRQHMKVDLPYLLLSFTLMLKSFPSCIISKMCGSLKIWQSNVLKRSGQYWLCTVILQSTHHRFLSKWAKISKWAAEGPRWSFTTY